MSVNLMSNVFNCNMPELITDDGKTVPDTTAKSVLLAMADNANDEGEGSYPGVDTLCKKTNYSTSTVCNALNALRHNGFTILVGKSKRDTNNYTISVARVLEFQWPKRSDSSHRNATVSAAETNPSLNPSPKPSIKPWDEKFSNMPLDWLIASGMEIPQSLIDSLQAKKLATDTFEKVFGFGSLPWASNTTWEKFYKWVVKIHAEHPTMFQEYVDWSKGDGKYKFMSNKQIRMNPLTFIDTGYPEFEAAKMYAKPKPAAPTTPLPDMPAGWQRIYDNA